jgi:hypothetical protein
VSAIERACVHSVCLRLAGCAALCLLVCPRSISVVGSARRKPTARTARLPACLPACIRARPQIEGELENICHDILALLEDRLIKEANEQGAAEARVFYNKMKGDYYRYLAEFQTEDERVKKSSEDSYKAAKVRSRARGGMPAGGRGKRTA